MPGLRGLRALVSFLWRRKFKISTLVLGIGLAGSVGWWQLGLSVSEIPLSVWVFIAVAFVTLPYAILISAIVVGLVYNPDRVILHEVDAGDGDVATHEISKQTYEELIVVNKNGQEIAKGHLHPIDVLRASEAYEVNTYDSEANVAEVSWMGEASNSQIRRHERMLERIQTTLSPLANSYSDLHAVLDMEVQERTRDVFNTLMAKLEGVELPPGMDIASQLQQDAGQGELDQLPDPEEELHELQEPQRRDGEPPMDSIDVDEPHNGGDLE